MPTALIIPLLLTINIAVNFESYLLIRLKGIEGSQKKFVLRPNESLTALIFVYVIISSLADIKINLKS